MLKIVEIQPDVIFTIVPGEMGYQFESDDQSLAEHSGKYVEGISEGAQDIDENGFWVGNHSTDCKAGIFKMFTILKGLAE